MDKALKFNIKELIKSKRGFEFEAFINDMHLSSLDQMVINLQENGVTMELKV